MYQALSFLALCKFLRLLQFPFYLGQVLILQLCHLFVVVVLLGDIHFGLNLILLLSKGLKVGYGVTLIFPLSLLHIKLIPKLGELLLKCSQSFLGKLILFLL